MTRHCSGVRCLHCSRSGSLSLATTAVLPSSACCAQLRPRPACGSLYQPHRWEPGSSRCGSTSAGAVALTLHRRPNPTLLWNCLDGLPNGEQDLLGPPLDAALEKLTALPDPAAGSECGVQLMTISKSKGLE